MRRRRALGAVVLPLALLCAGCNGSPDTTQAPVTRAGSTSDAGAPSPGGPTKSPRASASPSADGRHAVAPPGPRRGSLTYADMLVFNPRTLSDADVAAIRALEGVVSVDSLALAQVSVEDRVLNVAAIDPATYRHFTPAASADTLTVWERVAGGELAIRPELRRRVPIDEAGFLRLGNDRGASEVHVGAFAPQVPQIDAVVNESWIRTLGMDAGNALILNSGERSPQSLRDRIEDIAGPDASVQILGPDLDTSVQQTALLVGTAADAVGAFNYTVLGGGRIAPDPAWVSSHIATGEVPILGNVTCNRLIFPQLRAALSEVVERGLAAEIDPDDYAGCYYPRFIAGTTTLSNHSFGLALDLNVSGNGRGTVGEMDRTVVEIFKRWGFAWGGDWSYTDPMHFEMNALVEPGS